MDHRQLAKRNNIAENFTIYPGQKIYLYQSVARPQVSSASSTRVSKVEAKSQPGSSASRSKTTTSSNTAIVRKVSSSSRIDWQWPVMGNLLATFSSQNKLNMGVDISGRMGESVVAAASGVVVYAGNGIRGYGNLLIVKHNETYLSAYAHNSRLLVKEQAVVKGGQKIAELGSSGTNTSKLHFEIRREGKPVDPLRYLPTR